jgi:predicted permease
LTNRLKRAARRERVRRYAAMCIVSAVLLSLLLAPLWMLYLLWSR